MRARERLTALKVTRAKKPGYIADGGGLYLRVTSTGTKSWMLRYQLAGEPHYMGLGPIDLVSLAEARDKAIEARRLLLDGHDPLTARRKRRQGEVNSRTFAQCATAYVTAHEAGWGNPKHRAQWRASIEQHVNPVLGAMPVSAIDTPDILRALEPLWRSRTETAVRLRARVEAVLDWARVHGYRSGENPARWRGHLDALLPSPSRVRKVEHHAAMPYADVPAFMAALRTRPEAAARAFEFLILTAVRSGEAIGARWDEIDIASATWTIPASRMKSGKEHRVPLSPRAMDIISDAPVGEYVFPGRTPRRHMSSAALLRTLKRMGITGVTVHGFRSSFRDWAGDRTSYPRDTVEMALAHAIGNATEAAYRRGDAFDKRRQLMEAWAGFCSTPAAERIVTMARA
jgi:integrase